MSTPFDMQVRCPTDMTVTCAGADISAAPDGVANGGILVQMLLSSRTNGEMTAMRAFVPPGTLTHWHSHPHGQLLFVVDGVGLVQCEGGEVLEVRAGDSVWFPPDMRHWHGATSTCPFSYVSVQAVENGSAVRWFEPVTSFGATT